MTKTPPVSRLGYAILGLLKDRALSGYDVRQEFTTSPMGHYSDSPGAIYPALKRLERDGFVAGRVEGKDTLRPRRVYRLTSAGRAALAAWIGAKPVARDIIENTSDWFLRLAFATDVLSRAEVATMLEAIGAACKSYAEELHALTQTMPANQPYPRFALNHGVASYRATAAWAAQCLQELKGKSR